MRGTPRVSIKFEVDQDVYTRSFCIPYGSRSKLMGVLFVRLVEAIEKHGHSVIGAVYSGKFSLEPDWNAEPPYEVPRKPSPNKPRPYTNYTGKYGPGADIRAD